MRMRTLEKSNAKQMLTSWDQLQNADLEDVANVVFAQAWINT